MPPKLLLAARPETYEQQIGEKRKRIETLFATFNPPELQVFESERENYRMRYVNTARIAGKHGWCAQTL